MPRFLVILLVCLFALCGTGNRVEAKTSAGQKTASGDFFNLPPDRAWQIELQNAGSHQVAQVASTGSASGRRHFLSPDPLGHASDMSLYAFANGDPVNGFDPDGRLAKKRDEGTITQADYQKLAGLIGWDGFADNLSAYQQNYYGNTALDLLRLEMDGRDMSGAWDTIHNEVPGVLPNWEQNRASLALAAGLGEMLGKSGALQNASNAMLSLAGNLAREAGQIQIVASGPPIPINNRGSITLGNAAKQPQLVNLSSLTPPSTRPFADPSKLARHGTFDWQKYTPIIVEKNGSILTIQDGMTRVTNARAAGITELPAYIYPVR